jgi:multicomponent Na+:H+ antiporter subunit F
MHVLAAAIIAMLVSIGLVLLRGVVGPTMFDRILALNTIGTQMVVLIVLMGQWRGTPFFLDIAITYALLNFIGTIAFLCYFKYKPDEEKENA